MKKCYNIQTMAVCACILLSVVSFASATRNEPPETPEKPSGLRWVQVNRSYTYSTLSNDADGDQIWYNFSWGDGTYSDWIGPLNSGERIYANHTWATSGIYQIAVQAKDIYGQESEWSEVLTVITFRVAHSDEAYKMHPI